jgi:hypothetical protein
MMVMVLMVVAGMIVIVLRLGGCSFRRSRKCLFVGRLCGAQNCLSWGK